MMNGPFGPRPHRVPAVVPAEDVTRPLTRTYESNRGGSEILTPEWGKLPDKFGTFKAKEKQISVDIRTDGTNAERMSIATGLRGDRGVDENNNPRPFCAPGCTPNPALAAGLFWPHVVGRVEWGMGQAKFEAEFDWHHGTELSVVAETIRILARYELTVPPWAGLTCKDLPLLPTWRAASAIGYGLARLPATLTRIAQLQNTGDVLHVPVPPYAVALTVMPLDLPNTASFYVEAAGQGFRVPVTPGETFPLFNGAATVRVENINNTPPIPVYAFLVFELSL